MKNPATETLATGVVKAVRKHRSDNVPTEIAGSNTAGYFHGTFHVTRCLPVRHKITVINVL